MAASSDWYCRSAWSGALGPVPAPLDEVTLTMLHYTEESAREAAKTAQRSVCSHLGFIYWFSSVKDLKKCDLTKEDYQFVLSLRLEERPKAGVLFNISRDYHEMNLIHLANHNVAAHYAWTDRERADKRFLRLSPEYWNELSVLRSAALGTEVKLEDFASYGVWKEDLERTNWLFQNLKAGKRGVLVQKNWNVIRAYSERFHATLAESPSGTVCTFFRQNPIALDEPALIDRSQYILSVDFKEPRVEILDLSATAAFGSVSPSLPFEKFFQNDGNRRGGGDFYGEYREVERSSSPAMAPQTNSGSSQVIPMADVVSTGSAPVATVPSPIHTWEPNFQTREEALAAIANGHLRLQMMSHLLGLRWSKVEIRWLSRAVLICKDARSLLRLKTYATVFDGVTKIEDVLELGIRSECPSSSTLAALYAPGYVDPPITWNVAGGAMNFGLYQGSLYHLLALPHAIAFVPKGGVCRFVAEVFDKNIVHRYAQGPSVQVSEREVSILLGHVPGKHPSADTTLWPPPDVLESESAHFTGYLSQGAYTLLEDLRSKILEEHKYEWRTRAQWKTYLVKGSKGEHKPTSVPSKKDFANGKSLFERSFSENWDKEDIADLEFPMKFLPLIRQD
ncbi:hypothetical protein B0H13DRAFT_2350215 [Mycena leptocephala]|nr:hypothetical protein B0H13DRAFT_2350215 [Mycena leptocephala]